MRGSAGCMRPHNRQSDWLRYGDGSWFCSVCRRPAGQHPSVTDRNWKLNLSYCRALCSHSINSFYTRAHTVNVETRRTNNARSHSQTYAEMQVWQWRTKFSEREIQDRKMWNQNALTYLHVVGAFLTQQTGWLSPAERCLIVKFGRFHTEESTLQTDYRYCSSAPTSALYNLTNYYRAMIRRARLFHSVSSVCPSVCLSVRLRL